MEKISDYYPKPQTIVLDENHCCSYAYSKICREIRGNRELIFEFIRTDCDGNGYYRLLQIRKVKEVKLTDK